MRRTRAPGRGDIVRSDRPHPREVAPVPFERSSRLRSTRYEFEPFAKQTARTRRLPVSRILYRRSGGSHLSGASVAGYLVATSLVRTDRPSPKGDRAFLLRVGFTRARVTATLRRVLRLRFHPYRVAPAVCFCGTFLRVTPTGRYPARCPVKPGLSSRPRARDCPATFAPQAYQTQLAFATFNRSGARGTGPEAVGRHAARLSTHQLKAGTTSFAFFCDSTAVACSPHGTTLKYSA